MRYGSAIDFRAQCGPLRLATATDHNGSRRVAGPFASDGSIRGMGADWSRAGSRILAERSRHWRSRAEFAEVTGLSVRTLEDLETGRNRRYSAATLAAVEVALEWEPETCERLAHGGAIRYGNSPELRAVLDAWPHLDDGSRRMLADVARLQRRRQ